MTKGFASAVWAVLGALAMALVLYVSGVVHFGGSASSSGGDDDDAVERADSAPAQQGMVKLDEGQLAHAAIKSQVVSDGTAPSLRNGFARVMDVSTLAAIDADLATARGALAASRAEAERLTALASQDQSASRQAVEAARAKAASDAAQLSLAQRRIGLEFGPGLARMSASARGDLIADVGAGRAALLRVDIPGRALATGSRVEVSDGQRTQSVRIIGSAATTDPQLQDAAMLAILRQPMAEGAMAGRQFTATTAGSGNDSGVIVPRSALLRWQGQLWAYRDLGNGAYQRIAIDQARPIASGWLVSQGLNAGERIVTDGATTLFAVEQGGAAVQEDD